ncbi:ATP-binding cassette domain-containing protein, partial [Turicibacter sanguinis]|nr:ATP-binding cassette domain-containing protein [Turicibacter sanguinis]
MNEKSSKDVNRRDLNHLKYLISHAWKWDKLLFVYYGLFTLLTAVQPFISLFSIKWLIDELTTEMNVIVLACILGFFLLGGVMVNALVTFIKNLYMPRLILLRFKFINQMQRKAMKMDFRYTEDPKTLDDLENAGQAVSSNHVGIEGFFHKLFEVSGSLVSLLTYMSLLFMLSPWVLLYLFLNMLFVYYLTSRAKKYEFSKKDENAALNRRSSYLYNTMSDFKFGKEIRIYQLGNWLCEKFRGIKGEHLQLTKKIQKRYLGVSLVDAILILIREGIVYAYLIYCVLAKGLSLGSFSMYFTSISHFTTTLQSVMEDLAHLRLQLLYVNHFRTFLEIQDELPLEEPTPIPLLKPYTIEFKKVSFKYPNSERYIFKDLSFKIKAGERLAIVGINGAGKTTLVKLITRLYEPTDGEILLDGINVKNLDRAKYFDLFSVVFQDIKVLAFTVGENVAIQNRDVLDRARVMECLE